MTHEKGTSAEHPCPLLSAERQISLEVQEISKDPYRRSSIPYGSQYLQTSGSVWSSWVLRGRTSWASLFSPHLCAQAILGLPPDPIGNTFLLGMPAVLGGHNCPIVTLSVGPQASFLTGETHEATVPTGLNVTHSLPTQWMIL